MTKIKICGLTREEDALFCAARGADFLGFIFVPDTPRFIQPEQAGAIITNVRERESQAARLPQMVGVFHDASPAYIREIVAVAGLDLVQLHGTESDEDIQTLGVPAIKSFRVGDTLPDTTAHPSAEWLLFDTFDERRTGGTGRRFDWSLLAMYPRTKPFFLSGGIDPDNVAAAISLVRPDAIDLSSGVEGDEPGVKHLTKVERLFERIRR